MNIAVIINPASRAGSRKDLRPALERAFARHLVAVARPGGPEEATRRTRELVRAGADAVVAVGGDGTVNAVANGLVGSSCRLGIIPGGTANDLARSVGLPARLALACQIILRGSVRRIDVVRVNAWHFLTAGGVGLPVDVVETVDGLRRCSRLVNRCVRCLGPGLYPILMLYHLGRAGGAVQDVELRLDGSTRQLRVHGLVVTKVRSIGKHVCVAPGASAADGRLHVLALEAGGSRLAVARSALTTLCGCAGRTAGVRMFSGQRLILNTEEATPFCADGETRLCSSAFKFEVIPGGLSLLGPGA